MQYRGLATNWGVNSVFNNYSWSMQSRDHTYKADKEEIKNGDGDVTAVVYYNHMEEATLTAYVVGAANGSGSVSVSIPSVGVMYSITDARYSNLSGSTWILDEVGTNSTNTSATKITAKVSRYPNVTS